MQSKQCAFLLLRHCANTKIVHITRLSPPSETERACSIHDALIEGSLASLLGLDHIPEDARRQIRLKTCNGGLGLPSIGAQRDSAFLSSWSESLRSLPERVPHLSEELRLVVVSTSVIRSSLGLRCAAQSITDQLGELDLDIENLHLAPRSLRASIEKDLEGLRLESILHQSDQKSRARLLSSSCQESGAWVDAVPTTQHLSLSPEDFSLAVLMRLGLALPLSRYLSTCQNPKCSAAIDMEGLHLLTCGMGPGRVRLHDRMVRVWHSLLVSAGLRAHIEKRHLYHDDRRPDIVVPDYKDGMELHLDFSLTHP